MLVVMLFLCMSFTAGAHTMVEGLTGTAFNLTAKSGYITTGDGGSVYTWGYANGAGLMQYPGPTLILNQNDVITVTLSNELSVPVSIVFPGQSGVVATGGSDGVLTKEAATGQTVTYTFTASQPGTYLYHSGTRPDIQIEMGLVGAIVVRPSGYDPMMAQAYGHMDSMYNHDYLFLLTEMDPRIHRAVQTGGIAALDNTDYMSNYFPVLWFINGRNAPDTMQEPNVAWLPHQPYNSMPMAHPGDKVLMRVIGAGRDLHPFHFHGNHARVIARNGRLLESTPGVGADLSHEVFTIQSAPGETVDAIWQWTGEGLGWDAYGTDPLTHQHSCNGIAVDNPTPQSAGFDATTGEYCPDHGKAFPVTLPDSKDSTFGAMYSGSPFLGSMGSLPPGEGGMNPWAGFGYMWHSHTEKELTNNDIFPGGMMTMMIVVPPGTPLM